MKKNVLWMLTGLALVLALAFAGCDNGTGTNGPTASVTAVYLAGYYHDGSNQIACYWKNGIKINLGTAGPGPSVTGKTGQKPTLLLPIAPSPVLRWWWNREEGGIMNHEGEEGAQREEKLHRRLWRLCGFSS